eukprot:CAMPEP_0194057974 /NCGR_PEP_ID=MMETSP0009_2-20130614/64834_1 /TAXON_ID=210454 /ORGANISM="Grammatophora oceanica, Strain CCMP 410" /LENGTH=103 /DNA_ID=CAMNT_0038707927 /DNA_START=180 /DNA_END=492 /DNA_ORIENTATION=+
MYDDEDGTTTNNNNNNTLIKPPIPVDLDMSSLQLTKWDKFFPVPCLIPIDIRGNNEAEDFLTVESNFEVYRKPIEEAKARTYESMQHLVRTSVLSLFHVICCI